MPKESGLMAVIETLIPILSTISGVLAVFVAPNDNNSMTLLVAVDWSSLASSSAAVLAVYHMWFEAQDSGTRFELSFRPIYVDDFRRTLELDERWVPLFPR